MPSGENLWHSTRAGHVTVMAFPVAIVAFVRGARLEYFPAHPYRPRRRSEEYRDWADALDDAVGEADARLERGEPADRDED